MVRLSLDTFNLPLTVHGPALCRMGKESGDDGLRHRNVLCTYRYQDSLGCCQGETKLMEIEIGHRLRDVIICLPIIIYICRTIHLWIIVK